MKRKLTKTTLSELELHCEIMKLFEQKGVVGGGSGSTYSMEEYLRMTADGNWTGGYVEGVGYVGANDNMNWDSDGNAYVASSNSGASGYGSDYNYGSDGYGSSYSGYGSDFHGTTEESFNNQTYSGTCIPTVMSYAAGLLGQDMTEGVMVSIYNDAFKKEYPIYNGIPGSEVESFLRKVFSVEKVGNTNNSIQQALKESKPIVGALRSTSHMVLINGFSATNGKFKCKNPGNGKVEYYSANEFYSGGIFLLKSVIHSLWN